MKHDEAEGETKTTAIGEGTPVKLGLILSILGIVGAGVIASAVWVATQLTELRATVQSMQTTLNAMVVTSGTMRDDLANHKSEDSREWNAIKARVLLIEQSGSQATRDFGRELNDLRNDFHVHEAISKQKGGMP